MQEQAYNLKKLELDGLLEITQAINANLPEESLYKIFHFTLLANLNVQKHALFVLDEVGWICKVLHGLKGDLSKIKLPKSVLKATDKRVLTEKEQAGGLEGLDVVIPIKHKDVILAYVFVSDAQSQNGDGPVDISFVETLSNIILVAIENKKLARQQLQQEALKKELEIARQVQSLLFPKSLPDNGRVMIEADYFPHRSVGGDYYDYIPVDEDHFFLCVADVSGKGVPAAMIMSNVQASLRTLARQTRNLREIITELNYIVRLNANGERFITVFLALFDLEKKTLLYVNAGHNPPYFMGVNGQTVTLDTGTTVLGAFEALPFLEVGEVALPDRLTLFAFTDGVTETTNAEKEEYGEEQLQEVLFKYKEKHPKKLHEEVMQSLNLFRQEEPYADDITLLTCKVNLT